jgi:hypothetical protein
MNEEYKAYSNKSETFKSRKTLITVGETLKDFFMLNGKSEGEVTQISKILHKDNELKCLIVNLLKMKKMASPLGLDHTRTQPTCQRWPRPLVWTTQEHNQPVKIPPVSSK